MAARARKRGPIRLLRRYAGRPALLALLTFVCLAGVVRFVPRKIIGMPEARWNTIKADWHHDADMLIMGDSRACSSLLPKVMAETFPEARIKNFGFPGTAYLPDYLDHGLEILDPGSKQATVIFGFSSKTLTNNREGWPPVAERKWSEVWKWRNIPTLMTWFEPLGKWEFINVLRGHPELGFWREHREDGSYLGGAVWRNRPPTIEEGRAMLARNKVQESQIADVLARVRALRAKGVTVFGVRFPSSTDIEELENTLQAFDEAAFVQRFTEAGGIWIRIPDRNAYTTYDLSHMVVADAERFSRWFSHEMVTATSSAAATRTSSTTTHTSSTTR